MGVPAKALVEREERRAPPLAAVEFGWLVGKRIPLSDLPTEKQLQIREVYKDTNWAACDESVDFLGFFTDYGIAKDLASSIKGGFIAGLPVNGSLPEASGRYTIQEHPNSEAKDWYQKTSPGFEYINVSDVMELEKRFSEVCKVAGVT